MRMFKVAALLVLATVLVHAADTPDLEAAEASRNAARRALMRSWQRSLVPLLASQSLDAASSYGYRELNPLLAGPNGAFGVKATTVKFAVVGALIGVEYLLSRKSPKAARLFTRLNWSSAAVTTGLAVHNYVVR